MAISFLRRRQPNPVLNDMVEPTVFGPVQRPGFASARKPLFGDGYLAGDAPDGTTTVEGTPTPITVRVVLRTPQGSAGDGLLVAETQSNAAGLWRVEGLNPLLRYDVIGRLLGKKDVIVSDVTPKVDSAVALTYFDAVMQYAPVGYWRLGELTGTTAADSSGNGRDGTYTGTYTLNQPSLIPSDTANGALGCNGTGLVDMTTPAGTFQLTGWTWIFAIKPSAFTYIRNVWWLGNASAGGSQGGGCQMLTDGKLQFRYFNGSWIDVVFTSFTFAIGTAYRVAIRFNSSTSISLLVNGSLVETKTAPPLPPTSSLVNVRLGGVIYLAGEPFFGDLDEFAIIPSLLTDAQIYELETIANSI